MQIELSCVKVKTVMNESKTEQEDLSYKDSKGDFLNKTTDFIEKSHEHEKNDLTKNRFECRGCGYIYEPSEGIKKFNIPAGTPFLKLDQDQFRCPVCRVGFESYIDIGPKSKPSGFEENLGYGFGFNKLPSGKKNVLIFGSLAFAAACFLSLYSLR